MVEILLAAGANLNAVTRPGVATGCFMRDARTRGESALHRAAAFGSAAAIEALLRAGARKDLRDAHGDSPLSWASWLTWERKRKRPYRHHPQPRQHQERPHCRLR